MNVFNLYACSQSDVDLFYLIVVFFFFKQKTAYEMLRSLVGSEMCIRDRPCSVHDVNAARDYAERLLPVRERLRKELLIVMRLSLIHI